jgi:hypothetical protein
MRRLVLPGDPRYGIVEAYAQESLVSSGIAGRLTRSGSSRGGAWRLLPSRAGGDYLRQVPVLVCLSIRTVGYAR